MSQAYYDIYIDQVKRLAKTMVIKSVASALAVNTAVLEVMGYPVSETDPTTWKYYMNLAGQYHPTDTMMTVLSLDTQQTIEFTTENLQVHLATAREYSYGSQYYVDLLARYPEQEQLILGIINPIPIDQAIAAKDNAILWYDPSLVESNETNLIPQVQEWIDGVMFRWNVANYALVDDLYVPAQLALVYINLPLTILNIRLANCHTRFVHSYHIKEYLASNGGLDVFVQHLTTEQQLWLYRNVRYIQRNPGQQITFEWLMENILTARGLPLASWTMRHNLEGMPESLYPTIEYTRSPLNLGFNKAGVDVKSTLQLLDDEVGLAKQNGVVEAEAAVRIDELMKLSRFDRLATKVLESNTVDTSDSLPFTLADALLNHWLYLASLGSYTAFVEVINPATADKYTLSVKEAFVLYFYSYWAQYGFVLDEIPPFTADCVRRIPRPEYSELLAMVDLKEVPESVLNQLWTLPSALTETLISVAGFNKTITAVHQSLLDQRTVYTQRPTYMGRAQAEAAALRMYHDVQCVLDSGSYQDWLDIRNINLTALLPSQFGELANAILVASTGADLNSSNTLANIQASMLGIMKRLSSYTVQFVQKINTSRLHVADWAAPRLGTIHEQDMQSARVDTAPVRVIEHHQQVMSSMELDVTYGGLSFDTHLRTDQSFTLNTNLDQGYIIEYARAMQVRQSRILIKQVVPDAVDITGTLNGGTLNAYQPLTTLPMQAALMYTHDTTYSNPQ